MERLIFDDPDLAAQLFGPHNLHLEILAKASGAHIFNRGSTLCIETNDQDVASALTRLFCTLYDEVKEGLPLDIHALSGLFSLNMKLIAQRTSSQR